MATLIGVFIVVAGLLLFGYLLLRFNSLWIYKLFDRAVSNERNFVPFRYELPRYFVLDGAGKVDTRVRWPGWDGWYFFVVPEGADIPIDMARASLMTGLYGLEGIDNYQKLRSGLSAFDVVEHLVLVADEEAAGKTERNLSQLAAEKEVRLSQRYLPKPTLEMSTTALSVAVSFREGLDVQKRDLYGRVRGQWPDYEMNFECPQEGIAFALRYKGEDLVWWADVPGLFTYFAAFGSFEGTITYQRSQASTGEPESPSHSLRGRGSFEHGCARKPFNFDFLYTPVKLWQYAVPSFRPVRYHYELLIGDKGLHGGFMFARAFGIDFRNRGGVYAGGEYLPITGVQIEYQEKGADRVYSYGPDKPPVVFYRRWKVTAATSGGPLEYSACREWPPPVIAKNMMYYNYNFEGTFRGQHIQGKGYGEYINI